MLGEGNIKWTSVGVFGHPLQKLYDFKEATIIKVKFTTIN